MFRNSFEVKKIFSRLMLSLMIFPIENASAALSLDSILTPLGNFGIAEIYLRYFAFIDALVYLVLFLSLSQMVFRKVYKDNAKESKMIAVAISLALTISMIVLENSTGFHLGQLYPVALLIFLAVLAILLFNLMQGLFTGENSKKISAAVTFLIIYGLLVVPFNTANTWISDNIPLLGLLLMLGSIVAFISLLISLFGMFTGSRSSSGAPMMRAFTQPNIPYSENTNNPGTNPPTNPAPANPPPHNPNPTPTPPTPNPRPPGPMPTPTPRHRYTGDPPTDTRKIVPGITPSSVPVPTIPREPKKSPIPEDQKIIIDLSPQFCPIRSQDGLGACTAFAATSLFEYVLHTTYNEPLNALSPMYLWYKTREDLGKVSENDGPNTCVTVMNNLRLDGVCYEKLWSFEDDRSSKWIQKPSGNADADAVRKKIMEFRSVDKNDPDQFIRALMDKHPLNIAIKVPAELQVGPEKNAMHFYHNPNPKNITGGHAIVLVGYHSHYPMKDASGNMVGVKAFKIRNSWDVTWGENGYIWISAETLVKLLIEDPILIKGKTSESLRKFKITGRVIFDPIDNRIGPKYSGYQLFSNDNLVNPVPDSKDPYYVGAMCQIKGQLVGLGEFRVTDTKGRFSFEFSANPVEFEPLTELKKFSQLQNINFNKLPSGIIVYKRHKDSPDKNWYFHIIDFRYSFAGRGGEGFRDAHNNISSKFNESLNNSGIPITFNQEHTHEMNVIIPIPVNATLNQSKNN